MDIIFMNSENSKTSEPHVLILNPIQDVWLAKSPHPLPVFPLKLLQT